MFIFTTKKFNYLLFSLLDNSQEYICSVCSKQCTSPKSLKIHLNKFHGKKTMILPPRKVKEEVKIEEIKRKKKIKNSHKKMLEKPPVMKNDNALTSKSPLKRRDEDLMAEKSHAKKDDVFQKLRSRQDKKPHKKYDLRPSFMKKDKMADKSSKKKNGVVTSEEESDETKDDVDVVYEERRSRRSAKRTYLCLNFSSPSESEEEDEENDDDDNYTNSCTCMYCEKKFLNKSALKAHLKMHLG